MNNKSIRMEGGWPLPDTLPYDEDLLRQTLGLSPRVAPNCTGSITDFYPDSVWSQGVQTSREGALKRNRITEETTSKSREKIDSDWVSTTHGPLKGSPRKSKKRRKGNKITSLQKTRNSRSNKAFHCTKKTTHRTPTSRISRFSW